ncbi:hypothetical protein a10_09317 [Streptomyces acidiscabies]|nr:hypothetical protein a10_09317 [Streptomyces acidiscabies]GAV46257.1 hypothetical protein Saa2_09259 [Streptomyces acidiscabies]
MRLAPHWPLTRRSSKALETLPLVVLASTVASAGWGRRMAISPETFVRETSVGPAVGSRSTIIEPLTESALTEEPASTTVRSPETELKRRSPVSAWASTPPETVSARTGPERPTSVMSPVTPWTLARPSMPETTAAALTTPTATRVSVGTARVTTACRRQPLRSNHLRKPFQGRSSYVTVRTPSRCVTIRGGPSIAETSRRGEPSSVPTTFTAPETSRTLNSRTGSSKENFFSSDTDHSGMTLTLLLDDTPYRVFCSSRYIALPWSQDISRHSFR